MVSPDNLFSLDTAIMNYVRKCFRLWGKKEAMKHSRGPENVEYVKSTSNFQVVEIKKCHV
jgi:hypothetical protein